MKRRNRLVVAGVALLIPAAALADIKGTLTVSANTAINFDTGTTSASGGDVLWSGTALTPQGKATAYNAGPLGATAFGALTQSTISAFGPLFSSAPIPAASLVVNDVFGVKTNGGNYGAGLVTAVSGTTLTVQFVTFGVSSTPSGPAVTSVINNYSYIPAGFANSGIAQGALFLVIGTGLADPAAQAVLQSSMAGLPSSLNGASVKVVDSSGATVTPLFYYAISTALGMVLPSNTALGTAQLTVSYNGQSSPPFSFQVVKSAMGFDSYDVSGSGLAVATNALSGSLYNYNSSIPVGTIITLWGSGLGASTTARDTTYTASAFAINNLAHIYVGGVEAQILYQGASVYPGVDQINVMILPNTPTGCGVSLVGVTADGTPSNFLTLPIGTGPCTDAIYGSLGSVLSTFTGKTSIKIGTLFLEHQTSTLNGTSMTNDVAGTFLSSYSSVGTALAGAGGVVSQGGCTVAQVLGTGVPNVSSTGLNAGTITVKNSAGTTATLSSLPGAGAGTYFAQLPSGFITSAGGSFAFHATGGTDVNAFDGSVVLPTPLLAWTNQSSAATVTRSSGLPIMWTGGAPGTYVNMTGNSSDNVRFASFNCTAPVSAGQFTVPPYVLAALPAGNGQVNISNQSFTPLALPSLDFSFGLGDVSAVQSATFK